MKTVKLGDISNIEISGIDKKIKENEISVRLCNFTDIYRNWTITEEFYNDFMQATANTNEISKFALKQGQVAITKDSETRDDIGMSAYIDCSFEDVVLGYHCALITPNESKLNGKFLNAFLNSKYGRKYFEFQASGSGQRYTLTNTAIASIRIPLIDIELQEKIGNIFDAIDKKMLYNNQIQNTIEDMMKTLYQRWFLEYEFPNNEGKPYKSNGGKFIYNDKVKQEIPIGWNAERLLDIANLYQPQTISTNQLLNDGIYSVYGANGIIGKYNKYNHEENEIAITCRGASCGNKVMTMPYSWITGNAMVVKPKDNKEYLFYSLSKERIMPLITGSAQPQLTRDNFNTLNIITPNKKITDNFEEIATKNRLIIQNIFYENQYLTDLRNYLLPMLVNGQININEVKL